MIDSKFRHPYQTFILDPLLRKPWILKWHPHALTGLGLLLGLFCAAFIAANYKLLSFCFLSLSGLFDTLDGSLARTQNRSSNRGAVLDIFSDRVVEFAIVMGLYGAFPEQRAFLCLCMLGSILLCITSFLVVGIFTQNTSAKSFHYSPGLMERTEAFVFFTAMIFFPQSFAPLALTFTLLVTWTGIKRIHDYWCFEGRR
ncbi:MAG TPA: CDP-alcohol phosphatidyltransferase family protein [Rhabdochlamydiaceae bacterium]|nr:CDP-alcohol phosphatidyltransferase family protein [Rhabdochlamydiaceae bacterium]